MSAAAAARAPRGSAKEKPKPTAVDRAIADAANRDEEGYKDSTPAQLRGHEVRVKPFGEWTTAGHKAQRLGDFETWAQDCLAGDDYARIWVPTRPTINEVYAMFESWETSTGDDLGESAGS